MKIAVCDDSREGRGILRALLAACGHDFEIREYGSGGEFYADMGHGRAGGRTGRDGLCVDTPGNAATMSWS